jgi:hypothetical protein
MVVSPNTMDVTTSCWIELMYERLAIDNPKSSKAECSLTPKSVLR